MYVCMYVYIVATPLYIYNVSIIVVMYACLIYVLV